MTLESIAWRGTHIELPDTKRTVHVYGPKLDIDGSQTWLGWFDPDTRVWHSVDAAELDGVTHWAELLKGAD